MKRCPACTRIMPDNAMILCPYDGSPLLDTRVSADAFEETIKTEQSNAEDDAVPSLEKAPDNQSVKENHLEIARNLNDWLEQGSKIVRDCARHANGPIANAVGWEYNVREYIEENLGEAAALDFGRAYPTTQYPDSANNREIVDRLYTKLQRLGHLMTKLLEN